MTFKGPFQPRLFYDSIICFTVFYYLSSFYLEIGSEEKVSVIGNLYKLQTCLEIYILIAFLLFIMNGWMPSSNTGLGYHLYYLLVHMPAYESIKMDSSDHVLIFIITIVVKTLTQKARELNSWTFLVLRNWKGNAIIQETNWNLALLLITCSSPLLQADPLWS